MSNFLQFDRLLLCGYVPLMEHGFALPVYGAGPGANDWYIASPTIDGDHAAEVAAFMPLEGEEVRPLRVAFEVGVGDPWRDVFLWKDAVIAGTPGVILEALDSEVDEIRRTAPLSLLDLCLATKSIKTPAVLVDATSFLKVQLGDSQGASSLRELVVRPTVLIALRRLLYLLNPAASLPGFVRNFAVLPRRDGTIEIEFFPGTVTFFKDKSGVHGLDGAIAQTGQLLGLSLNWSEKIDGTVLNMMDYGSAVDSKTTQVTGFHQAPDRVDPRPDIYDLIRKVLEYEPDADTRPITTAYELARDARGLQTPDVGYALAVAGILADYHLDIASICAALLQGELGGTSVQKRDIEGRLGRAIGGLVDKIDTLTRLETQSYRIENGKPFSKRVLAMGLDIRVLMIKLADRLHKMRTLGLVKEAERRQRIARETMDIYAPLAARIGMHAMKSELQTRAFAILEPEAYGTVQARLNYLRGQGADVIEEVRRELAQVCREYGVEVLEVSGREKSAFSIWEKMQRRNVAFEQLSDIMAFRIVLPTREQCYMALGAVHAAYPVIAGRFKDYISTPKANGYQSLHTRVTLRYPRNQTIELQIRTPSMQAVIDTGVAARWDAKKFDWIKDLLEIVKELAIATSASS